MMPVARCEDLTAGCRAETDIEGRIIALEALTTADLQIEWRRLYRAMPPTRLSRDLLIRGVAYRLQEQAHGGLSLGTKRRLRSLAEGADQRGRVAAAPAVASCRAYLLHGALLTTLAMLQM